MRLARGAGRVTEPVPVGDLVRGAGRGAGPVRRGPKPGPAAGPGPVHRRGAARAAPVRREAAVPADRPGRVRRAGRSRRGRRAPPRRPGTRTWCWVTGGISAPAWPIPRLAWARSWTSSG